MSVVVHAQILRLHGAAIQAGLASSRSALLSGLAPSLTASLAHAPTPSAQLMNDLSTLNEIGDLGDGSVPLETWLGNALALAGPRVQAAVFRDVLGLAQGPAPVLAPTAVAAPVPAGTMRSTFISFGGPDQAFAKRLVDALKARGVETFFFPDDAVPGEKLHRVMWKVNAYDRVILICSARSLDRNGVLNEIEQTITREARDGGASYLIPITLDDFVFSGWNPERADLAQTIRDRVVADFRGADGDLAKFAGDVERLAGALKR